MKIVETDPYRIVIPSQDNGAIKVKDKPLYCQQVIVEYETTLTEVQEVFEEVESLPVYDFELIREQEIIEKVQEAGNNPIEKGMDYADGLLVSAGDILRYNGKLYAVKAGKTFVTQWNWNPERTLGHLWEVYEEPTPEKTYPVWDKTKGTQGKYMKNDIVHYPKDGDLLYISTYDGNITEPTKDAPYDRYWKVYTGQEY